MGNLQTCKGAEVPSGARHLNTFGDREVIFFNYKNYCVLLYIGYGLAIL